MDIAMCMRLVDITQNFLDNTTLIFRQPLTRELLVSCHLLICNCSDFREMGMNLRACLHGGGGPQVGEVTRLAFAYNLKTPGCWDEVFVALAIREFGNRRPKLKSRERRKIHSQTRMYLFKKVSRVVLREVPLT